MKDTDIEGDIRDLMEMIPSRPLPVECERLIRLAYLRGFTAGMNHLAQECRYDS